MIIVVLINPNYRNGIDKQLACAAKTLQNRYVESVDGVGVWRAGKSKKSLDQLWVKPANHATAALYGYTPWVLEGTGGNWLVWNITRKYIKHFKNLDMWDFVEVGWVGSVCSAEKTRPCEFTHGDEPGFCFIPTGEDSSGEGFCSIPCAGYCPDQGSTLTFCVELTEGTGSCVAKPSPSNHECADIPGTIPKEVERFVGDSGVPVVTSWAYVPE